MSDIFDGYFIIYRIRNAATGRSYVGKTENFKSRICQHFSRLKHNKHICKPMQSEYNIYGVEAFGFHVLRRCTRYRMARMMEMYFVNKFGDFNTTYKKRVNNEEGD